MSLSLSSTKEDKKGGGGKVKSWYEQGEVRARGKLYS